MGVVWARVLGPDLSPVTLRLVAWEAVTLRLVAWEAWYRAPSHVACPSLLLLSGILEFVFGLFFV